MAEHEITVDVYASWSSTAPRYRVYVDDDLLTERDFDWPGHEVFIREHIIVHLAPGTHCMRVEQISTNGIIRTENVTVDSVPSSYDFVTV